MSYNDQSFVTKTRACHILKVSPGLFLKVAAKAGIRTKSLPGMKPRYCLEDVEALRARAIVPARARKARASTRGRAT